MVPQTKFIHKGQDMQDKNEKLTKDKMNKYATEGTEGISKL